MDHPNLIISISMENFNSLIKGQKKEMFLSLTFCFRNPRGRTGLAGRGCLGRWGPNHAADPIVTRYLPITNAADNKFYKHFFVF